MIQLVIFDMAGTIIDEDNVVYKTILDSFIKYDYPLELETVLKMAGGKEKKKAIADILETVFNENDQGQTDLIHKNFEHQLEINYNHLQPQLYQDVRHTFQELKKRNIKVGINTGFQTSIGQSILNKCDLIQNEDYDILVCADDVENGRPAPDMIFKICEELKISPNNSIKIGDTQIDIEEGKNAGVFMSIGITTGAQSAEHLLEASPNKIIHTVNDLLLIIDEINEGTRA